MVHIKTLPDIKDHFAINVIENKQHELLLLRRSRSSSIGPGLWGFPAGRIEIGESPEQCSLRETHEEIGSDFNIELLKQFGPVRDTLYGGNYTLFLFHYRWKSGSITLNHEHTDYAWVCKENFHQYEVVDGVDEDICYLGIWPSEYLNQDKLPDNGH